MLKKKLIALGCCVAGILFQTNICAQEQKTTRELAEGYYYRQEYAKGLPLFERLWNKEKNNIGLLERIANSYRQINDYQKAEEWYALLVNTVPANNSKDTVRYDHFLSYIEVLQNNSKYSEAKEQIANYLSKGGNTERAAILSEGCDLAPQWRSNPTDHIVQEQKTWNTTLADWGTSYYGNQIVFASERGGGKDYKRTLTPFTKLFQTSVDTGGAIYIFSNRLDDYKYHVGPAIFNKSLDTLYFTRTNTGKATLQYARDNDRTKRARYRLELFMQTKQADGNWSKPIPFAYNDAKHYSLGHAALSPSGDVLYYASDKAGGYGGVDIYYSEKQADGSWGTPKNCGPAINTFGDEMFPTIMEDGALYYSTDGKAGMGGLDIFTAEGARNQWRQPVNMQYPINSAGDDFYFQQKPSTVQDQITGYLSSNRISGTGSDDIYSFSQPSKIILVLDGVVTNSKTGELIASANLDLIDIATNQKKVKRTDTNGSYYFELDKDHSYKIVAQKEGYQPDEASVSTVGVRKTTTFTRDLKLTPQETIVLEGIYYDFNKSSIRKESQPSLNKLLGLLQENPDAIVEIGSHTDARAPFAYNIKLSQRRAQSVVNWLGARGINKNRMRAKGYGESQPRNNCTDGVHCSEFEHQRNRRTEFRVVGGSIDIKSLERFNMHVDPCKGCKF
ncbi:OmpA family protein [Polluticoccus soli]|uniref:OmpA family protein n=1 Tax=Polluticoccus soli TaxID=3034150 RepID=UPI0023E18725|nr:OmpA family protein [Flavipsychrobacter sp. JY13-12]